MLWKILPVTLLVMAVVVGCRPQPAAHEPATSEAVPATPGPAAQAPAKPAAWGASLPAALQAAQSSKKPLVVDFFATWCGPCKQLEETWADPQVASALTRFITVKIDVDKQEQLAQQYKIEAMPTILFLAPDGKEKARQVGYMGPGDMRKLLDKNG